MPRSTRIEVSSILSCDGQPIWKTLTIFFFHFFPSSAGTVGFSNFSSISSYLESIAAKMDGFIIPATILFIVQIIICPCDCKGILRPHPLTQTPPKGIPDHEQVSSGSLGPLSEPRLDSKLVPGLSLQEDPSKCEPSIYIAPVLNISTQAIEKKLASLNRQVQLLSEQVRILTSREASLQNQGTFLNVLFL